MRQIECAYSKCDFETRGLIIGKWLCLLCHPERSYRADKGSPPCHPERSGGAAAAKSKDLYKNKDDIRIEIPRGARDDRGEAAPLCHPEGT